MAAWEDADLHAASVPCRRRRSGPFDRGLVHAPAASQRGSLLDWLVSARCAAVDHVLDTIPGDIVLGIPLGMGKPNPFVNALYRRIKANPASAACASSPRCRWKSRWAQRPGAALPGPLVERVFGDYPDLDYVKDLRAAACRPTSRCNEFFMKTGDYLGNAGGAAELHPPPTTPTSRATWRCRA
jgi:hypothetical protein